MKRFRKFILISVAAASLCGCRPDGSAEVWSKGSVYKVLEEKGGYSCFLEAVDRSGYRRLVDGGGLITLFAPDDKALGEYLREYHDAAELDELTEEELKLLVGYHMIQFSYTPENFRSFSSVSSSDGTGSGDGACFKFRTYMKNPPYMHTDARTGRKVFLYSREKYMPVMSAKLFKSRGVADAQADYRRFFPDVDWTDDDMQLYLGNARVVEEGIQTDNGYVYTVDKVLVPSLTVYERLSGSSGSRYSIVKRLFDRISCYTYDAQVTKNYSATGDSLYYFYHWTAPTRAGEIPEIASEWTYHDESGSVFERGLRYCNNCFFPDDEVLEPYLKEYFKEWGTYEADDFVNVIPKNAIYHFLMAHIYGCRDIILPSELDMGPVIGSNGEKFSVSSSKVAADFCDNGVIYGMKKIFEPGVYTHITAPLFMSPNYKFYSYALNVKNMYQQTVDDNNRFTLFVQNDDVLSAAGYTASQSSVENGSYTLRKGGVMSDAGISNLVMSQFVYGDVDFKHSDFLRYYVSKDDLTYFYVEDNHLYDCNGAEISILKTFQTKNGNTYEIGKVMPARSGNFQMAIKDPNASQFAVLLMRAGIINSNYGYNTEEGPLKPSMIFIPDNEAVIIANVMGMIPKDNELLKKYLRYYFVPLEKNKLEHFLLPGVGPDGMTVNPYSVTYVTASPYSNESDAKYVSVSWDPSDPKRIALTNSAGTALHSLTSGGIALKTNCAAYYLDSCFDYREIFEE